jgi:hypothetical protein
MWKEAVMAHSRHDPNICLEGLTKTTCDLSSITMPQLKFKPSTSQIQVYRVLPLHRSAKNFLFVETKESFSSCLKSCSCKCLIM